ncbi:MAG: sigma-54-dependent Fis family transcriptional regulator [Desulfobacteraceae bacterium]|nr:sigma-54-dependent Fis family transcriptional regulator [Desulfobacteraceae bacterium]
MTYPKILFVDDDNDILSMVHKYLTSKGYNTKIVDNGLTALGLVKDEGYDIVFTDFKMPEFSGLELLAAIKKYRPETEVIIVTGYATMESAIEAMKYGSYDYLQKPFKLDHLKLIIDRIAEERKIQDKNKLIRKRARSRHRFGDLLGMSPKMQEIYELIETLRMENPMILIQGESGTGKELVARTIHAESSRKDKPFIPLNCNSIGDDFPVDKLQEHVQGLVQTAMGGTIYLDEISELASSLRLKLLQTLEAEKKNTRKDATDVRIIAATQKELEDIIKSGALKKDIINLLNAVFIKLPPLRERKEDICLLINHFFHKIACDHDQKVLNVTPETLDILLSYHWPGNLIQLQNVFERAYALNVESSIQPEDLPAEIRTFSEISKARQD